MRSRPKGEQDRGHHDKPDSTGEVAGEELEMDDRAQEAGPRRLSFRSVVRRSDYCCGRCWHSHAASTGSSPTSPSNHHTTAKPGNGGHGETGRRHRATVTEQTA